MQEEAWIAVVLSLAGRQSKALREMGGRIPIEKEWGMSPERQDQFLLDRGRASALGSHTSSEIPQRVGKLSESIWSFMETPDLSLKERFRTTRNLPGEPAFSTTCRAMVAWSKCASDGSEIAKRKPVSNLVGQLRVSIKKAMTTQKCLEGICDVWSNDAFTHAYIFRILRDGRRSHRESRVNQVSRSQYKRQLAVE
ncbi:uncharacterized protein LAESUDRAFT_718083 [Laetiporus sulphureus 93-53]|uniref:Uncharacterized protein n=1 Tax=Laetiporus sulphureus 93-53 TaxID=1314785 RepID=A0A165B959_9APHY|nr:uncharacterized protein LAESUDRAFT_718083 [Laetiporus sulphureus 93-53]KZT00531.1 hypothetical protein LAESUDRAFT_718083 [Laetiporus sulphureus 93-53]